MNSSQIKEKEDILDSSEFLKKSLSKETLTLTKKG